MPAAPPEPTYTRSQILKALTLEPCHVTGEHDPTHTARYICRIQRSEALNRVLRLVGVDAPDLPRRLHQHCRWCGTQEGAGEGAHDKDLIHAWAEGAPLASLSRHE